MCWKCENPNATDADYLKLIRDVIVSHGWFIQHVEKDRWRPTLSYTVGLTELCHPELLVTGLAPKEAGHFLSTIAHGLVVHDAPA